MKTGLLLTALTRYLTGLGLTALLLLTPAGTVRYPRAWLLLGALFIPILILGTALYARSPALLKKRLDAKETEPVQRRLVRLSGIVTAAALAAAGLNFRYSLTSFPTGTAAAGAALLLAGWLIYAETLRENPYLARTVRKQEGQKVIDTGLYRRVRHPMYAAALILFLAMPLILDSPISLAVSLAYIPIIVFRIRNEEKTLERELEGYAEYKRRVKWRLAPGIW